MKIPAKQHNPGGWWDSRFTDLLVEALPPETGQLVHYRCGSGEAAAALLPRLPDLTYVGVETDPQLLQAAETSLMQGPLAARISLRLAGVLELPVPDRMAGAVLSLMALQHCSDVRSFLHEVERVLKPWGGFLAVEPDNLGQRFYFDGPLEEITNVVRALCMRARVARQPADIAVGPLLPKLLKRAGFADVRMRHHTVGASKMETAKSFCDRLTRVCENIALLAELPDDTAELEVCREAIRRFRFVGLPKRLGFSAHVVPVFLTRAIAVPT